MDPATIIGTTSAILSFVQFAGNIIKTAVELHSNEANATEVIKAFDESVADFKTRLAVLKTRTSQAGNNNNYNNSVTADDAWINLLTCSSECEKLGERISGLLEKCKTNGKASRPTLRERLRLYATHKRNVPETAESSRANIIRASVMTVWRSDEIDCLRGQWSQCIAAFNAACTRYGSPTALKYENTAIQILIRKLGSSHVNTLIT